MSAASAVRAPSRASHLIERLWGTIGAVGIRTKILGMVLALVLLLGLGVTVQVRAILAQTLDAQLRERAISVTRDLAARSTDLILIKDFYALHELLRETQANNPDVRYVFVVDSDGQVLAHTFGDGFPPALLASNRVAPTDHHRSVLLSTDEGLIWDTAVPIFGQRAGTARVGLSEIALQRTIDTVTGQLLLTTMMVSVIGITAAALLTWLLTRPILQLVRAAHAVGAGDLAQRVPRWANDEIGDLARAFNSMTEALADAAAERAEREQLRARYVSSVIAVQEDERKRIARELHDGTSQSLTSLLIGLRALGDQAAAPALRERAEELRQVVAQTLDEVHSLAVQLRPSVLDDLGLPAAIQRHISDLERRQPIAIDLAVRGLEQRRLPPDVETALYRIVQESLTNIIRHAHASTASVLIECGEQRVRAIIEDDGIGFDPPALGRHDGHLGLYGIRERAELLGGSLTIESERGSGTSLFVELPLTSIGAQHIQEA